MRNVPVAENLTVTRNARGLQQLTWSTTPGTTGAHVWRRDSASDRWVRLTSVPAAGAFEDPAPALTETEYLIRVLRREIMPAGSWWNASTGIRLAAAPPHPVDAWKALRLSSFPANLAADDADADADGLSNLVEYALGSDPAVADDCTAWCNVTSTAPGLALSYLRAPSMPGVVLCLSTSSDLTTWTDDLSAPETILDPAGPRIRVSREVPMRESRCFVRLTVRRQ